MSDEMTITKTFLKEGDKAVVVFEVPGHEPFALSMADAAELSRQLRQCVDEEGSVS